MKHERVINRVASSYLLNSPQGEPVKELARRLNRIPGVTAVPFASGYYGVKVTMPGGEAIALIQPGVMGQEDQRGAYAGLWPKGQTVGGRAYAMAYMAHDDRGYGDTEFTPAELEKAMKMITDRVRSALRDTWR